jgi:hypothetical protein
MAMGASDKDQKGVKGLTSAEDKITDSVKGVVKHIGTTDSLTLDDLNTARQAVAKIEALIDIEKHLAELEKVRSERDGGNTKIAAAIPASALAPMPPPLSSQLQNLTPPPVSPAPVVNPMMSSSNLEVSRIIGGAGRYSAIIKTTDGQNKTIQVGDKLSEGSTVVGITSAGVELDQNGKTRMVHVKNVNTVFGDSP